MTDRLCTELIERYLCTRGRRFFRGQHDGEYFFVANTAPRRLYVHLELPPEHPGVLTIRITPVSFFPAADRSRLNRLADAWNLRGREVTAIVHGSSDPQRVGIAALRSQPIRDGITFEEFGHFVDRVIGAAIELFAGLTPIVALASITTPLLQDAG